MAFHVLTTAMPKTRSEGVGVGMPVKYVELGVLPASGACTISATISGSRNPRGPCAHRPLFHLKVRGTAQG